MSVKVIVACAHLLVAEGITELINGIKTVQVITYVTSSEAILQKLEKESYQLLLLDNTIPKAQQVAQSIKALYPQLHLILLLQEEFRQPKHILPIDALAYLQQNQGREQLEKLIRQVASGKSYWDRTFPVNLSYKDSSSETMLAKQTKAVQRENHPVQLSKREVEILTMIGQEFASKQIADLLFISVKTVETHRRNIMKKIGVHNFVGLLKYALQQGLL